MLDTTLRAFLGTDIYGIAVASDIFAISLSSCRVLIDALKILTAKKPVKGAFCCQRIVELEGFDQYYNIGSHRLFVTLVPIIREVQGADLAPVLGKISFSTLIRRRCRVVGIAFRACCSLRGASHNEKSQLITAAILRAALIIVPGIVYGWWIWQTVPTLISVLAAVGLETLWLLLFSFSTVFVSIWRDRRESEEVDNV